VGNGKGTVRALVSLAMLYAEHDEHVVRADAAVKEALELVVSHDSDAELGCVLMAQAAVLERRGEAREALERAAQAEVLLRRAEARYSQVELHCVQMRALLRLGDVRGARTLFSATEALATEQSIPPNLDLGRRLQAFRVALG
jgi:ATP/maltotriose-dependent transcriptional regulator MalT